MNNQAKHPSKKIRQHNLGPILQQYLRRRLQVHQSDNQTAASIYKLFICINRLRGNQNSENTTKRTDPRTSNIKGDTSRKI